MDKDKIKILNNLLENQQCKHCIFSSTCDFLIDSYKKDICQILNKESEEN